MSKHKSHQQRVKQLLAQDPEINDTQMKEFRMQLDQALESSETMAKQTRRRILIAFMIYVAGIVAWAVLASHGQAVDVNSTAALVRALISLSLVISIITATIIGIWMIAIYFIKHKPLLNRARFDLQTAILLELQQQVKKLSESIERRER